MNMLACCWVSTCIEVAIVGIGIVEVASIAVAMVANAIVAEAHVEVTMVAAPADHRGQAHSADTHTWLCTWDAQKMYATDMRMQLLC